MCGKADGDYKVIQPFHTDGDDDSDGDGGWLGEYEVAPKASALRVVLGLLLFGRPLRGQGYVELVELLASPSSAGGTRGLALKHSTARGTGEILLTFSSTTSGGSSSAATVEPAPSIAATAGGTKPASNTTLTQTPRLSCVIRPMNNHSYVVTHQGVDDGGDGDSTNQGHMVPRVLPKSRRRREAIAQRLRAAGQSRWDWEDAWLERWSTGNSTGSSNAPSLPSMLHLPMATLLEGRLATRIVATNAAAAAAAATSCDNSRDSSRDNSPVADLVRYAALTVPVAQQEDGADGVLYHLLVEALRHRAPADTCAWLYWKMATCPTPDGGKLLAATEALVNVTPMVGQRREGFTADEGAWDGELTALVETMSASNASVRGAVGVVRMGRGGNGEGVEGMREVAHVAAAEPGVALWLCRSKIKSMGAAAWGALKGGGRGRPSSAY